MTLKPFDLEAAKRGEPFSHSNDSEKHPYKFIGTLSTGDVVIEHNGKPFSYPTQMLCMLPKKVWRLKWTSQGKSLGQISFAKHEADFDSWANAKNYIRLLELMDFSMNEVEV